jgi:uncharacterized protein (DUF58 family)
LIVPTTKGVRVFAATILPAALAVGAFPGASLALYGGSLLFAAIAAADALLAERRGKAITVDFPQRLQLSRDREGAISFALAHPAGLPATVTVALQTPEGFISAGTEERVQLPSSPQQVMVRWPLTATRRGNFLLPPCRLRVRSPLGLWHSQASRPAGTEVRVYPNLRAERKELAGLFLNRNDALVRPQRQLGKGREFEKLRLYLPGDALGDIHWRATAKRGQLVTKEFRCERTQEVYLIVDASRLSARPVPAATAGEEPILERYIRSALILGSIAQQQGDLFGVMAFSDRVLSFKPAGAGREHFGRCRDSLYKVSPGSANPAYDEAASFLARKLKRRALLIFLGSLEEPAMAEAFAKSIGVLSRRHLVSVAMLRPAAATPLFCGGEVEKLDDLYRRLGGHLLWHTLREMQQNLRLQKVQLSLVQDERLSARIISLYLDVKRRQLL